MPQYFLFAWQVTHHILILLHQSSDDVFNDFFFLKYSCSFSFVFMDHVSPLLPLQPDSCVSLMFNSFSRQLWTTLSTSQNFIKVLEKDLWVLPVSC